MNDFHIDFHQLTDKKKPVTISCSVRLCFCSPLFYVKNSKINKIQWKLCIALCWYAVCRCNIGSLLWHLLENCDWVKLVCLARVQSKNNIMYSTVKTIAFACQAKPTYDFVQRYGKMSMIGFVCVCKVSDVKTIKMKIIQKKGVIKQQHHFNREWNYFR